MHNGDQVNTMNLKCNLERRVLKYANKLVQVEDGVMGESLAFGNPFL